MAFFSIEIKWSISYNSRSLLFFEEVFSNYDIFIEDTLDYFKSLFLIGDNSSIEKLFKEISFC
jgi:hypothetical protein